MKDEYIVYKVKQGDTLESIARRLSINPKDLMEFHNKRCATNRWVWSNNLWELKEMIVPINYLTPRQQYDKECKDRPSERIAHTFYKDKYAVKEEITVEEVKCVDISYDLILSFFGHYKNVLSLTKENFKKQGRKLALKTELLAQACYDSVQPISYALNERGRTVGLYQYEELVKRYEKNKLGIEGLYIGRIANSYIGQFNNTVMNHEQFYQKLSTTILHQALFPKINWFIVNREFEDHFSLPYLDLELDLVCEVEKKDINRELVSTKLIGRNAEVCFSGNIGFNKVELSLTYITTRATKQMVSGEVCIKTYTGSTLYSEYKVSIS